MPLCASLLRLVRQGVLMVLAAGNEGSGEIVVDGFSSTRSFDLSIGDPANLEEAIMMGSVHQPCPALAPPTSPRGAHTADGRLKPDVVGPEERILSCRSSDPSRTPERDEAKSVDELYVALSGTSRAPHLGLLAAFLSVRTEFIGYPERVKRSAAALHRPPRPLHQGAGLPNLSKMLLHAELQFRT